MRGSQHARRMKAKGIWVRLALAGAGALLPLVAAAQIYRPEAFDRMPTEPSLALGLSPSGIDAFNRDMAREAYSAGALASIDARSFGALVSGKVGADRLNESGSQRPGPWVLYARAYVFNFSNNLGEQKLTESQIGFGRTGPAIAGRVYVGIRKRF
jgi:hypothetical protein